MVDWSPHPYLAEYAATAALVKKNWSRLHRGDQEPLPRDARVLAAWALYHGGRYQEACEAGLAIGDVAGVLVANRATCVYANFLEKKETVRLALFLQAAERAQEQLRREPDNPNAWYSQAYALGRYSQGISVAKALALGLGAKVKQALERTIALCPHHADAHVALGTFHAEVIDKVGPLIGGMTYGARRDIGRKMFETALALHPDSPIALIEYAHGLMMLDGDRQLARATELYGRAAQCRPADATERLDVELAKAELDE
ncbi:MAG: hypothetical protein ABI212_11610 [Burkholderiaceae bacterium]